MDANSKIRQPEALAFCAQLCVHVLPALHRDATFSSSDSTSAPLFTAAAELAINVLPSACRMYVTDARRKRISIRIALRMSSLLKARLSWLGSPQHEKFEKFCREVWESPPETILEIETPNMELKKGCRLLLKSFNPTDDQLKKAGQLGKNLGLFFSMMFVEDRETNRLFESTADRLQDCVDEFPKSKRNRIKKVIIECKNKFYGRYLKKVDIVRAWGLVETICSYLNSETEPKLKLPTKRLPLVLPPNLPLPVSNLPPVSPPPDSQPAPELPKSNENLQEPMRGGNGCRLTWINNVPHWGTKPFKGAPALIAMLKILVANGCKAHKEFLARAIGRNEWREESDPGSQVQKAKRAKSTIEARMSRLRKATAESWGWDKMIAPADDEGFYAINLHSDLYDKPV